MKKKLLGILLTAMLVVCAFTVCVSAATTISTADELIALMNDSTKWAGDYVLGGNIDLSEATEGSVQTPIGNASVKYSGTFDGAGYTISGVNITGSTDYTGFFGCGEGCTIKNLTLDGEVTTTAGKYIGGLMGWARNVTIDNCHNYIDVTAKSESAGGILGYAYFSKANVKVTVKNCTNHGTINGSSYSGGIVGDAYTGNYAGCVMTITGCENYGAVTLTGNVAGGILGYGRLRTTTAANAAELIIADCANYATITASDYPGGIMGAYLTSNGFYVKATLKNLYNEGNLVAKTTGATYSLPFAGGIAGLLRPSKLLDSAASNELPITIENIYTKGSTTNRGETYENAIIGTLGASAETPTMTITNAYTPTGAKIILSCDTTSSADGVLVKNNTATPSSTKTTVKMTNTFVSGDDASALGNDAEWINRDGTVSLISFTAPATTIANAKELAVLMRATNFTKMKDYLSGSYTLGANVDLTGLEHDPIGDYRLPFTGTFDGGNNTISGISMTSGNYTGLFGAIRGATVKNLTAKGAIVPSAGMVGGIVGVAIAPATIENVTNEVSITGGVGNYVGGVLGMGYYDTDDTDITITNCTNNAEVEGYAYTGGIAGAIGSNFTSIDTLKGVDCKNNNLTVTGCVNTGNITAATSNVAGGIMGYYMYRGKSGSNAFTVSKCANYGVVSAPSAGFVGGIVGAIGEQRVYVSTIVLSELYNAGGVSAKSVGNLGTIVGLLRNPAPNDDGTFPVTVKDIWNTVTATYGMVGSCDGDGTSDNFAWTAERFYNAGGSNIIGTNAATTGTATITTSRVTTTVTLTDCFSADSDAATALSTLVTDAEDCAWVNRYDLPELKEFAQEEVQATLDSVIDSEEELVLLMNSPDRWAEDYTLGANLNLAGYPLSPIGTTDNPFTGTFAGEGYTISNMTMSGATYVALFGSVNNATIKNVTIVDATITASGNYASALVANATGTTSITNCSVDAEISGAAAVGMILANANNNSAYEITVSGCTTSGSVTGTKYVGGQLGRVYGNKTLTVTNCTNSASVEATGGSSSDHSDAGGIVGRLPVVKANGIITITGCSNSGSVNGDYSAGGILGEITSYCSHTADISGNTNTGAIEALNNAGGIIGQINDYYTSGAGYSTATVTANNNTNRGTVSSDYQVGGIIGYAIFNKFDAALTVNGSKNYGSITGGDRAGGLIGFYNSASTNSVLAISASENHGAVKGAMFVGGIIGRMEFTGATTGDSQALTSESLIQNCANYGDVTADKALLVATSTYNGKYAGGMVGLATTTANVVAFDNVYNEGAIHSTDAYSGGIFGLMRSYGDAGSGTNTATTPLFTLSNADNRGVITSDGVHVGGLVGLVANSAPVSITSSATQGTVSGTGTTHAVVGLLDETTAVKHTVDNVFYSCDVADTHATAVDLSTDFSELDTNLWMIPVASYYAPELKAYHTCENIWYQVSDGTYSFGCICGSTTLGTAAEKPFVYVAQASGANTNDGLTVETAVVTLDEAVTRLAKTGGDVIIAERYTISSVLNLPAWEKEITFTTGVDASTPVPTGFKIATHGATINMNGPAKFESIVFNGTNISVQNNTDSGYYNIPVIAANWNDLTMGNRIVCYGVVFIAVGSNGVSASELDLGGKTVNITLNRTTAQAIKDEDGNVLTAARATYDRIYLGDRVLPNYNAPYTVKNVHINFTSNDATFNNVWLATTSNATSNAQMENYTITANFNGASDAYIGTIRTGDGNTSGNGTASLTKLELNINGNAYVKNACALRNIKELVMSISAGEDRLEGSTYKYNECAFTIGASDAYTTAGTVDITYGTHAFANGIAYPTYADIYTVKETIVDECTREDVRVEHTADVIGSVTSTCTVCERSEVTEFHVLDYSTTAWSYDDMESAYVVVCPVCGEILKSHHELPAVYVGDDGDDKADGYTAATKVKTLTEATRRIAAVGGTVMFNGYVTLSEDTALADWGDNTILFTADPETHVDGVAESGIYITTDLVQLTLGGKSEFDAIAFKGKSSSVDCVIINAMWHDIDFGYIHAVNYGACYLVAGQWGATESDTTEVTQVINVDGAAIDTTREYFFGRIYMGSEVQADGIEISNKHITLNVENGFANANETERTESNQIYTLYTMSTTGNNNYCNSTTNGCVSVVNMYGDMSVNSLRTGDRNASIAACTGKCDDLTLNFMGNSNIDGSAYIRNCYKTTINVSGEKDGRTTPMAHSFFFYGYGSFVDSNAKVYLNYGSHSFVSAISYPPVTLDADKDGDAYVLVSDGFVDECNYVGKVTTPSTDTTFGEMTYTCDCGRSYTEKLCGTYAHEYVKQADGTYICQLCGATTTEPSIPTGGVLIAASAGEIADGKVTVDILIDSTAVAGALFTVDAPEGFTLESVADAEDSFYLETSGSKIMLVNLNGTNVAVDNAVVATLTYAVDEKVFNTEGEIVITALEVIDIEENNLYTLTVNGVVAHKHTVSRVLVADTADKAAYYLCTCTTCGYSYEEAAEAVEYSAAYSSTVVLESDLRLQIVAKVADKITDPSKIWLIVESVDENGNVTTEVVNPYHAYPADEAHSAFVYRFNATSVSAKEIGDEISVTFCVNKDGVKYAANTVKCNIISYYSAAKNAGASEAVMNALDAMMNYGAAAQEYFNYNTANLATSLAGVEKIDYATDTSVAVDAETTYGTEGITTYTYSSLSASLKDKVVMVIKFNGAAAEGLVFKGSYTDIKGNEKTFEVAATVEDGAVVVRVDAIAAKDLRKAFTGALYNGDTQVSNSVTTSFEAYAAQAISTLPAETKLHAVCRAALAYSDAAAKYFLSK